MVKPFVEEDQDQKPPAEIAVLPVADTKLNVPLTAKEEKFSPIMFEATPP
jgi:hypothetical protein